MGIASGLGGESSATPSSSTAPRGADRLRLRDGGGGRVLLAFVVSISEHTWNRVFVALDAAVIGFWAVSGAQKTLAAGLGWLPAVLLGITTAVGGGAVRDVLLRRVPAVFGGNGLYATVAAVVAATMVVCTYAGVPLTGVVLGVVCSLALRLLAVRFGWGLPNGLDWQPAPGSPRSPRAACAAARIPRRPMRCRPTRPAPAHGRPVEGTRVTDSVSTVLAGLDAVRTDVEDLYRDLHAHPELGLREHRTAGKVAEALRRSGYAVTEGIGTTGVVGVLTRARARR
ncbi:TRIC cation channel family protein [Streptomyces sp. M19]